MSDFPTLDLLERCGLGAAFKVLMLGARSASDFQTLCEDVIPPNCRLPRAMAIDLKRERDRWLGIKKGTGRSRSSRITARPSHAEILSVFTAILPRITETGFKPGLTSHFCALLKQHASGEGAGTLVGEIEYPLAVTNAFEGQTKTFRGILADSNARFDVNVRRRFVTVEPPDGLELPPNHHVTRQETKLVVIAHIDRKELTFAKCEHLLALPPWQHQSAFRDYEELYFVLIINEKDVASWFDYTEQQALSIAGLERLRKFLIARGIDIPRLVPGP